MIIDDTMKADSKLGQNCLNVLAIEAKTNDTQLTVDVLNDFITSLSIHVINTRYNSLAQSVISCTIYKTLVRN